MSCTLRVKDGYILREVAGAHVVVPVGQRVVDFSGLITLNATGAFLWTRLADGATREDLVAALTEGFDVSPEQAASDVESFTQELSQLGVLEGA